MPYNLSVSAKGDIDAFVIEGIPDDVAPDSPQIKERVTREREKMQSGLMAGTPPDPAGMLDGPEYPPDNIATETPLGRLLFPLRTDLREYVASQPPADRFILETGPTTIGTAIGTAAGAPLGPLGMLGGGMIGGGATEYLSQLLGFSPRSNQNITLSAAAPLIGPSVVKGAKVVGRTASSLARANPVVKSAERVMTEESAVREFGNVNAALISKLQHRGLVSYPSSKLYQIIDDVGVTVTPNQFTGTFKNLRALSDELDALTDFAAPKAAKKLVDNVIKQQSSMQPIPLSQVLKVRSEVGKLLHQFERSQSGGGAKVLAAGTTFAALSDDLAALAKQPGVSRRAAQVALAANKRFKIERAGEELERVVEGFVSKVPGEESLTLNVNGLRKALFEMTNPKHKKYDKLFTEGAGDILPEIQSTLTKLSKITKESVNPAGAGSLVVRGAAAAGGATVGAAIAGTPGAVIGGIAGTRGPEALMKVLLTPTGRRNLERLARLGKGEIDEGRLAAMSQMIMQAALKTDAR
tara:strand:- start:9318 stop:10889 length:1572 start_codon:yes stop_codon:yes gene_type:complete